MDANTIVFISLSMIQLVLLGIMSIFLYRRMKETELWNLKWLITLFFSEIILGIGQAAKLNLVGQFFIILINLCLIQFVQTTFRYLEPKNYKKLWFNAIFFNIMFFIFRVIEDFIPDLIVIVLSRIFLAISLSISSLFFYMAVNKAELELSALKIKDNLIQKRYSLLKWSSVAYGTQILFNSIRPLDSGFISTLMITLMVVGVFIFVSLNYYAWVRLSNKKSQISLENDSESQSLEELDDDAIMAELMG